MKKERLIIVGAGGHARSSIEVIESTGSYEILGLIGSAAETGTSVLGYSVLGTDSDLVQIRKECRMAVVAIGQIRSPDPRRSAFENLQALGFELPVIAASTARVARSASIGAGTMIFHFAVLNSGVRVGQNCIVNTRALLEHDVVVGSNSHISTAAVVNGQSVVGDGTFLGSGAVVRECVRIGSNCIISMGARVLSDIEPGEVFLGAKGPV